MQRLIIDTDPGVDDAQAILMAAAHPQNKIEAILAVGGNVGLTHTVRNALTIVEIVEQKIPVYAGCDQPLVHFQEDASFFHGLDGLGDAGFTPQTGTAEAEHAVQALIRMANAEPESFTLVALAPLTNIAVALQLDPDLPHKLNRFIVMGGAVTGKGNTSNFTAEFNIYHDPEAAFIVFQAWARAGKVIELLDWEATLRHPISSEALNRWQALNNPRADFFSATAAKALKRVQDRTGHTILISADAQAMAVALEPTIVQRAESHHMTIALDGEFTRGQTVVDWSDRSGKPINVYIVLEIDQNRYQKLMYQGIAD